MSSVKVGVPAETRLGERRVALVPDVASRLVAAGFQVVVEAGAGEQACYTVDAYQRVGVAIEADRR